MFSERIYEKMYNGSRRKPAFERGMEPVMPTQYEKPQRPSEEGDEADEEQAAFLPLGNGLPVILTFL